MAARFATMFYFTSALCFAFLSNSRLAFVIAVAGVHSTPLLRSLARALLVLQMASLPQGLSAMRYCVELHGIIANDYEVQGLARLTSSGVTLALMLNVEGINSFDVKIPHYTVDRNTRATFEPTAKASHSTLQVPFRQQLLIGFLFDTILVYRISLVLARGDFCQRPPGASVSVLG